MTQKIYRTARGKSVDIGSLRLQNEHVRAVGNMGVNARGDRIDSKGNVIDSRNNQLQRQIQRQTNVADGIVHTNSYEARNQLHPDPRDFADEDDLITPSPVVARPAAPVISQQVVKAPVITQQVITPPVIETPVIETPIVTLPVIETPVIETPVIETPVIETPIVTPPVIETPVITNLVEQPPMESQTVVETPVVASPDVVTSPAPVAPPAGGGLAAAIARAKNIKQELEKTPVEKLRDLGVRKI